MTSRLRTLGVTVALCVSLAALSGCAGVEADRAAAAASVYMSAYGRGDREAVAAVTVPSMRKRPLETGIEALARGFTGVTEAEVEGNWAIAGARVRLVGPTAVIPILMRRTGDGWQVATIVPPGLTEVFSAFSEYPDPPPDRLEYMPTRRLTSRAWAEDESTPELHLGTPQEMVMNTGIHELGDLNLMGFRGSEKGQGQSTGVAFLKFAVSGFRRVHIDASSSPDADLRLELVTPEGGRRASNDSDRGKRGDHFYESAGEAGIQMNLSNATYLLAVMAKKGSRVRLVYDTIPSTSEQKQSR